MNDLGFGMLDKRSIAATLFALGLSGAIGLALPLDFSNVGKLFVSLVLFTGALYLSRTMLRLLFMMLPLPFHVNGDWFLVYVRDYFSSRFHEKYGYGWDWEYKNSIFKLNWYVFDSPIELWDKPFYILFRAVRFLDRLSVVGFVFLASIPFLNSLVILFGLIGIGLMLFIYVWTGTYSFVVRDAMDHMDEQDKLAALRNDELVSEQKERRNRKSTSYY